MRKHTLTPAAQLYLVVIASLALIALLVFWRAGQQAGSPLALLLGGGRGRAQPRLSTGSQAI